MVAACLFCVFRLEPLVAIGLKLTFVWALFNASLGRAPVSPAEVAEFSLAPCALRATRESPAVPGRAAWGCPLPEADGCCLPDDADVTTALGCGLRVSRVFVPCPPPFEARLADPSEVLPCVLVGNTAFPALPLLVPTAAGLVYPCRGDVLVAFAGARPVLLRSVLPSAVVCVGCWARTGTDRVRVRVIPASAIFIDCFMFFVEFRGVGQPSDRWSKQLLEWLCS